MTFINNTYWSVVNAADIEFPMDRSFAQCQYVPAVRVLRLLQLFTPLLRVSPWTERRAKISTLLLPIRSS